METEVREAIARIPIFDGISREDVTAVRLGGLTNRNYHITCSIGEFVLRLAGEGTDEYIDRKVEAHNARLAADAGVNAPVLFFDTDDGTMLCRYIVGALTLDAEKLKDLDAVARVGKAFKRLHEWGQPFETQFELFEQIDNYLAHVRKLNAGVPEGYEAVQREAEAVREALGRHA